MDKTTPTKEPTDDCRLLHCPFCGSQAYLIDTKYGGEAGCDNVAVSPAIEEITKAGAALQWNTRHTPQADCGEESLKKFLRDLMLVDKNGSRTGYDMSWKEIARRASEELCRLK